MSEGQNLHHSSPELLYTHSLISGGGDAAGSVVIHDTRKPKEASTGVYSCPVVASTFGS